MKKILVVLIMVLISIPMVYSQTYKAPEKEAEIKGFKKNNVSIFLSDVVMKRISLEYEYVVGETGNMSINIPVSYSIDKMENIYGYETTWWAGIGMKLYPTGQGKIRYFIGPEVRIIAADNNYTDVYYYEGFTEEKTIEENLIHSAFLLNNGMIYEPSENFIFSVNLGLGFVNIDSEDSYSSFYPMATPSVRMGIRF